MNWKTVEEWLEMHGHISFNWEEQTAVDSIYYADTVENTFISVFTKVSGELVVYVGCLRPKVSAGGHTGIYVESEWDVIDYLHDNLEDLFEKLNEKIMEGVK